MRRVRPKRHPLEVQVIGAADLLCQSVNAITIAHIKERAAHGIGDSVLPLPSSSFSSETRNQTSPNHTCITVASNTLKSEIPNSLEYLLLRPGVAAEKEIRLETHLGVGFEGITTWFFLCCWWGSWFRSASKQNRQRRASGYPSVQGRPGKLDHFTSLDWLTACGLGHTP